MPSNFIGGIFLLSDVWFIFMIMSKVKMPFKPLPKLSDILSRRGQTLKSWADEMNIKTVLQLELYCTVQKLQLPSTDDIVVAFSPPITKSQVEAIKTIEEKSISNESLAVEAIVEKPKRKKTKADVET